jgi:hypothetical protein
MHMQMKVHQAMYAANLLKNVTAEYYLLREEKVSHIDWEMPRVGLVGFEVLAAGLLL